MKASRSIRLALAALGVIGTIMPPAEATFPGSNGRIAWSRDGDIFTIRADGSGKRQLTDNARYESAQWSPDGRTLAVVQWPAQTGRVRILLMSARGSNRSVLARARFTVQHLSWSPDGSRLAYCDLDISDTDAPAPYPSAIKVVDVAAGTQSRLTDFADKACQPSWSPDGSRIAFEAGDTTDTDIFVMDANGSNVQAVTNDDTARQFDPAWSSTGDTIAFVRPIPHPGDQGDKEAVIETVGVDGTGLTTLTEPVNAFDRIPQWSPDGTKLLFFRSGADGTHLAIVNADGSGDQMLTNAESGHAAWSPDSTKIAFSRGGNIFVIGADGVGETKLVGKKSIRDVEPDWQAR